jgi:hypothetical protein
LAIRTGHPLLETNGWIEYITHTRHNSGVFLATMEGNTIQMIDAANKTFYLFLLILHVVFIVCIFIYFILYGSNECLYIRGRSKEIYLMKMGEISINQLLRVFSQNFSRFLV